MFDLQPWLICEPDERTLHPDDCESGGVEGIGPDL